jgi:hypothetical protein
MQQAQAATLIQTKWLTDWPALSGAVETFLDNEVAQEQPEFALLNVMRMPDSQESLGGAGNRRFRRNGLISIKICVGIDAGRARSDALVQAATGIFEAKTLPPSGTDDVVKTYAANVRELGSDGQHYIVLITIPFAFWELK